MSRHQSHINTAVSIIEKYNGAIPLAANLKSFFKEQKKYGSKDRKQIATLCYNYYRLGHTAKNISTEDRVVLAFFLCEQEQSDLLEYKNAEWNKQIHLHLKDKLEIVKEFVSANEIFPFTKDLSEGIDENKFSHSFLSQPGLFVRIRPGEDSSVLNKLGTANMSYQQIEKNCLAFSNATKITEVLAIDKEVVVQDLNSQHVLDHLKNIPSKKYAIWDCCAASGGKSILLYDLLEGNIELTVSDIRQTILQNLRQRFKDAGIKRYHSFIEDISAVDFKCDLPLQDIIICDAPCTGSGTWSRTPEQLYYFDRKFITIYSNRQKQIMQNILPYLKPSGLLVYITCSVFKQENEELVNFIKEKFSLQILYTVLLNGYEKKADSMFVTVFK